MAIQTVSGFYCDWHGCYESGDPALLCGTVEVCKESLLERTTDFWDRWLQIAKQKKSENRKPPKPVLVEEKTFHHLVYSAYAIGTISIGGMVVLLNTSREEAQIGFQEWLNKPGSENARALFGSY